MTEDKEVEKKTVEKKKKDKKWFERFFNKDKLQKSNKVAVVYLLDNHLADFMELDTIDGKFKINNQEYHVDKDCMFTTRKDRIPLVIIREWDIVPLGTKKWEDETMRIKFSELEKHVLRGIKNAELYKVGDNNPMKITGKQMILWGLAALIVGAVVINYI